MIRAWAAWVVLLLVAGAAAPSALSQSSAEPKDTLVEDESGDVVITSPAGPQGAPAGLYDRADIEAFWIGGETEESIQVGLKMKTFDPPVGGLWWIGWATVNVHFTLGEVQYRTTTAARCEQGQEGGSHALQVFDEGQGEWRTRECMEVDVDDAAAVYTYTIPKASLVDQNHVRFSFGDQLTGIFAASEVRIVEGSERLWVAGGIVPFDGITARDRAPDLGVAGNFEAVLGTNGKGQMHLFASEPMRVSNGESTTIVFQVELVNEGPEEDTAVMTTAGVDPTFNVRVPARITIGAGERIQFPVIVAMEFTHRHGVASTFEIKAESSVHDDSWSVVELGVFWTEIPQPAGHHNEMWLHSANRQPDNQLEAVFAAAFSSLSVWMNPLQPGMDPDPEATEQDAPAQFNRNIIGFGGANSENVASWNFPLSPGLLIGLDFDLDQSENEEASHFRTTITKTMPANSAQLRVKLQYCDPLATGQSQGCSGQWRTIASGISDPTSLAAGGQKDFSVGLAIDRSANLLPYVAGANLNLNVELLADIPQNLNVPNARPELRVADSVIRLPLIEYHDPIDQQFERIGSLKLSPLGDFEKPVNPGRSTYFQFKAENTGKKTETVALELEGFNAEWATFLEASPMSLEAEAKKNVTLMVTVPEGTAEGERAELFVVLQSQDDPTVVAVSRLRATVVDLFAMDIPEEESPLPLEVEADAPGAGVLALVAALGAAAIVRRRRP